jgi:hypothetical protein
MWCLKKNDEKDENMCMAEAGFIFLASKIKKKNSQRASFWVRPALSKRKTLTYTSHPYCNFQIDISMCSANYETSAVR